MARKKAPAVKPIGESIEAHSLEAELSVLGGILVDPSVMALVHSLVDAQMFFRAEHRQVFEAMVRVQDGHMPLDPITLTNELKTAGVFDSVGGASIISDLLDAVPTAANIEYHAQIVRQKAAERHIVQARQALANAIADPETRSAALPKYFASLQSAVDQAAPSGFGDLGRAPPITNELEAFLPPFPAGVVEPGSTPLPEAWKLMRAVYGGASRSVLEDCHAMSPYDPKRRVMEDKMNEALNYGRLSRGLHVIVGHTGGGKTALAVNLVHAAVQAEHPVVYVSLELDRAELAARLISLESAHSSQYGVPWSQIALRRPLSDVADTIKARAIKRLQPVIPRLYVWAPDPGPRDPLPTVVDLRRIVLRAWEENDKKTPLVIFDYLQAPGIYAVNYEQEARMQLRERIAAITMQLRHISKASPNMDPEWVGCPVVVLSTTARSNVKKGTGNPMDEPLAGMDGFRPDDLRFASLEDLKALPKEAGEVEATAVTSWALSLEKTANSGPKKLTLRLAKNRLGSDGQWLPLRFHGATGLIVDDPGRFKGTNGSAPEVSDEVSASKAAAAATLKEIVQRKGGS